MNSNNMIVSMAGDAIVLTSGTEHPEPRPVPGAIAKTWGACTIPGCSHGPCPAKLRTWAGYGRRYMCGDESCDHRDCPPRRRAEEDFQPFGVPYGGPALPQHVVDMDENPLGEPMYAVKDTDGNWRLVDAPGGTA
jgi:hypothetical protein